MSNPSPPVMQDHSVYAGIFKPFRISVLIAILYLIFGVFYIYVSSHIAALAVVSKEQLESIELIKGYIFILVTATFLFLTLFWLLQRLHRKERELVKQREAIAAAGKQAIAGLFASSIAHDLNNILSVSYFNLDILSESTDIDSSNKHHVDNLRRVTNEIQQYTNRLTDISGKHILSGIRKTNISATVSSTVKLSSNHSKVKRCSINTDIPSSITGEIDESLVTRALINAIVNAAEATNEKSQILVRLNQDKNGIRIEIHDNGPGISPKDRARVLEPFYSTKTDGTGLGLLSIRYCTEVHKGSFGIEKSYLGGACIFMVFPQ
ncbi:two component system sensor histidine kinase [Desulfosarcina variabilis str. Montpellier]